MAKRRAGHGKHRVRPEEAFWCRDPESNWGQHDFQSCALPTELSRQARWGPSSWTAPIDWRDQTGFEPAISCVTGMRVKPLRYWSLSPQSHP